MIREMTKADMPTCIKLGRQMHDESFYRENDYDEEKLWALWDLHVADPLQFCMKVAEKDGDVIGLFVGYRYEHFFGYDICSSDLLLYVTPEHRGSSTAVRLIKAYEQWARDSSVTEIQIGVSTGVREERTARLFEKLGFGDRAIYYRKRT
jgi:GNAT superfamily N-acetyltransferase